MNDLPTQAEKNLPDNQRDRRFLLGLISALLFFWFALPLIYPPAARIIYLAFYPISIIGTFIHEMGHGLTAIFTGGHFYWLQIEFFRGGAAITAGGSQLLILLGGLLGPAVTGAILLAVSTRVRQPKWIMSVLCLYFLLGMFFMIRPILLFFTGFSDPLLERWSIFYLITILVPLTLLLTTLKFMQFSQRAQRYFVQFLGVVSCLAGFSSNSYIFMYQQLPNGGYSDARMVAGTFWTGPETVPFAWFMVFSSIIAGLNIGLVLYGTWLALRPTRQAKEPKAPA